MKYKRGTPTVSGWYWFRKPQPEPGKFFEGIVKIIIRDGQWSCHLVGNLEGSDRSYFPEDSTLWAGPIVPPEVERPSWEEICKRNLDFTMNLVPCEFTKTHEHYEVKKLDDDLNEAVCVHCGRTVVFSQGEFGKQDLQRTKDGEDK